MILQDVELPRRNNTGEAIAYGGYTINAFIHTMAFCYSNQHINIQTPYLCVGYCSRSWGKMPQKEEKK